MLRLKRILDGSPIGVRGYAKLLDMADKTLYNKLACVTDFSYPEYRKLQKLFPEYNVDYLLTDDSENAFRVEDADSIQSSA